MINEVTQDSVNKLEDDILNLKIRIQVLEQFLNLVKYIQPSFQGEKLPDDWYWGPKGPPKSNQGDKEG